jgi:hypothetical protein
MGADNSALLTGLFYGGGFHGAHRASDRRAAICISVFVTKLVMMYALDVFGHLGISEGSELQGLDLHEGTASRRAPSTPCTARLHAGAPAFTVPAYPTGTLSRARDSRRPDWPRTTARRPARPDHQAGGSTCFPGAIGD